MIHTDGLQYIDDNRRVKTQFVDFIKSLEYQTDAVVLLSPAAYIIMLREIGGV